MTTKFDVKLTIRVPRDESDEYVTDYIKKVVSDGIGEDVKLDYCKAYPSKVPDSCFDGEPEMSAEDALKITVPFGKHKGKPFGDVLSDDPGYILWMLANTDLYGDVKAACLALEDEATKNKGEQDDDESPWSGDR